MNAQVEKLEALLTRVQKNRLPLEARRALTLATDAEASDVSPALAAQPTTVTQAQAPAQPRMPVRTLELELDAQPAAARPSLAELELASTDNEASIKQPFDEFEPLEAEEADARQAAPIVLDDVAVDAELVETPASSSAHVARAAAAAATAVEDIEISFVETQNAPTGSVARPAKAAAAPTRSDDWDEASFADVDLDEPETEKTSAGIDRRTPLEAAVQAADVPSQQVGAPSIPAPVSPLLAPAQPVPAQAAVEPKPAVAIEAVPVEPAPVAAASSPIARVVPAAAVEPETFGLLVRRSLGLRLR